MSVVVAPCSRKAAEHAVLRWHYSHRMPSGKLATFGVWEDERYTGAVIFGRGATLQLGWSYGLTQTECVELVRVAMRSHAAPVTQVVAESIRLLRKSSPGLRLIVSFADPEHGHHGGIYQAGNWLYLGTNDGSREFLVHGQQVHERSISSAMKIRPARAGESRLEYVRRTMDPAAQPVRTTPKHRYVYPLDKSMRRKLLPLVKPYPAAAVEVSTAIHHASGEVGQVRPLQTALEAAHG